jgi:oxygen-dependent protoporphyrinogen oxidase
VHGRPGRNRYDVAVTEKKTIAILGAGITGLTAAHRLHRLGHHVQVFEQTQRAGGVIGTELCEGWLIERGPNSLLTNDPASVALINELGLAPELVTANPAAKNRYIVRAGRLVPVPLSPGALLTTSLFSPAARLRILAESLRRPRVRTGDLSLHEFIRDHFGAEFADYALNPFVSGVYAGDPAKLSARHAFPLLWSMEREHGSLLRGQLAQARARRHRGEQPPALVSFRHGLQTLTAALAATLPPAALHTGVTVEHLTAKPRWTVVWRDAAGTHSGEFDAVISALPAAGLAGLRIGALGDKPFASLAGITHPPVASLFLGFDRDQFTHPLDGFGLLAPAREQRSLLGVIFSSTLFPGRAPDGRVALTVMAGGVRQPELAALSAGELLDRIRPDLTALLGLRGDPVFMRHTRWPRAIPQYNLGYEQHFAAINAGERAHPGFFVGGQVRDGIAVPACIAAGEKLAARAAN